MTGLLSTAIVVIQLREIAFDRDTQRFENAVDRLEDSIQQRMQGYVALLRATSGFIGGNQGKVSPGQFDEFVDRMKIHDYYRGAIGIGFSRRIPDEDPIGFIENLRQTIKPDFRITPPPPRDEMHAIVLLSPGEENNLRVIGYDMYTDPVRRAAMARARDLGVAAASGKVLLVQNANGDATPGFLVYVPVYIASAVPKSLESRQRSLLGFAYAPFRADEMFGNLLPNNADADLAIEVHDGTTENADTLLYQFTPPGLEQHRSSHSTSLMLEIAGRPWRLTARSMPAIERPIGPNLRTYAAIGGLVVTLLLTALTASQTRARLAAEVDRRAAEAAREEARTAAERLELVLKGARVGLWYSALPFETLQWDERVKTHFFLPPDESPVTVERAFERVHPDDRERIRAAMGWSIRAHAPFDVEYRTVSPDGSRMNWIRSIGQTFVDAGGEPIRFDVLTIDVTGLKLGQESLAESEAKFRQLANSIPQLAWIARPDGWMLWYNQRWYDYTGTTPKDMEGWGWKSVHHPDYIDRVVERWQEGIRSGEPVEIEFPIRAANGTYGWFLTQVVPLRDAGGNVLFWFGTNTDVSEHRRLADERERLLESERAARSIAERASRLKDEFLATLSHELRTPLNAILGWAQILRRQYKGNTDLADGLTVIERNARVQTQLVSDLLDMSRVISGKLRLEAQVVDPASVLSSAMESVRPAADAKDIELVQEFDQQTGPVYGDPSRLQQIVWNLLSNAIKFTPKGGRVRVCLSRVDEKIVMGVVDNGEGIEAEFLPHLFERFRQADGSITRRHGGLGLGLAIVKNLVDLHGGRVWATSDGPGKGASVYVELPVLGGQSTPQDPDTSPDPNALHELTGVLQNDALNGLRLLVIDDEADARELIRRVLSESGATVLTATSGLEGMDLVRRERPDVILSDIGMPVQDGYEFIRAVRQLSSDEGGATPAAALTAFARSEDRRRALIAGYQTHIAKPAESAELITVVAALAGRTGKPSPVLT